MLKPGGLLVALSGQSFLPEVMQRLGQRLRWWWLVHYATPGELGDNRARRVSITGKPLLVYANGSYSGRVFGDTVRSEKSESLLLHEWGQSESGMSDAIQRFSNPGDLVADPFLGSGTTAVAALRNGRRFVGGDLEPDCVQTTRTAGPLSEISISFSLSSRRERQVAAGHAERGAPGSPANPHLQRRCALAVGQRAVRSRPAETRARPEPERNGWRQSGRDSWGYPL